MKFKAARIISGIGLMVFLASQAPSAMAAHCSQEASAGEYGFTLTGVVLSPTGAVPIAAVGKATVDAAGNVTGTEARTVGGGYADETFSGTLLISADCTGTATFKFYEAGQLVRTSILSTVTDSNGTELRMVQKSLQLPNGAFLPVLITVEARKIFTED